MSKNLRKFNIKSFASTEKNRKFATDDEPTALATDVGKDIPTLSGESARLFLERAAKVEEEAKKRMNEPPTLEALKRDLAFQKFFLESQERELEERKNRIKDLEDKIKKLENELNGER